MYNGVLTHEGVANMFDLSWKPLKLLIAAF